MELYKTSTLQKIFIPAGNIHLTNKKLILWTTLGSCVSVIYYHQPTRLTGIFHAQLPERSANEKSCADNCSSPCYLKDAELKDSNYIYVSCSIRYLNDFFKKKNIPIAKTKVYLLGGSSILNPERTQVTVGDRNIEIAEQMLTEFPLAEKDVGGSLSRTIFFDTSTGKLEVKMIQNFKSN